MLSPVADISFHKVVSNEIELAARVENLFSFKAAHNLQFLYYYYRLTARAHREHHNHYPFVARRVEKE